MTAISRDHDRTTTYAATARGVVKRTSAGTFRYQILRQIQIAEIPVR
jgi:hypothetical protein